MKPILSLLLAAMPFFAQAAPSADEAAIRTLIAKHYKRPLAAEQCQLTAPPKGSSWASHNIAYCMKPTASHAVTRNGKTTRYALYTGFAYDIQEKSRNDGHAASGLAELFILEKTGSTWTIKWHGKDEVGAWGQAPDKKEWRFVQMGQQNWGYTAETGYTAQGETTTGQFYLFSDNRNHIRSSYIPTGRENSGYYGDCKDFQGEEKRNCENNLAALNAKLTFNRNTTSPYDIWAIEAKLSGKEGKKRYKNQPYSIPYNGKTYAVPKNYPLYIAP